jgi:hypothetical protein
VFCGFGCERPVDRSLCSKVSVPDMDFFLSRGTVEMLGGRVTVSESAALEDSLRSVVLSRAVFKRFEAVSSSESPPSPWLRVIRYFLAESEYPIFGPNIASSSSLSSRHGGRSDWVGEEARKDVDRDFLGLFVLLASDTICFLPTGSDGSLSDLGVADSMNNASLSSQNVSARSKS